MDSVVLLASSQDLSCRGFLKALDFSLAVNLFVPFLYLVTLLYPPVLKDLFVPSFLYCWPAAQSLAAAVVQSLQRKVYRIPNNFRVEMARLVIFLFCFIFTWWVWFVCLCGCYLLDGCGCGCGF